MLRVRPGGARTSGAGGVSRGERPPSTPPAEVRMERAGDRFARRGSDPPPGAGTLADGGPPRDAAPAGRARRPERFRQVVRTAAARPSARHLALLTIYVAAGVAVTWPS